jgi:hypothetical protein
MGPCRSRRSGSPKKPVLKSFLLFINLLGRIAGLVRCCSWPRRRSFSGRCEPKAVDRNERVIAGQGFKILPSPGGASARRGGWIIAGLCRSAVARGRSPRPRLTSPSSCGMVTREKSIPAGPGAGRLQQLDSPEGSASGPGRRPGFWPAPRRSVVLSGF